MIRVTIDINGRTIFQSRAQNVGPAPTKHVSREMRVYRLDDGTMLLHNRKKGSVRLAIRMLRTLRSVEDEKLNDPKSWLPDDYGNVESDRVKEWIVKMHTAFTALDSSDVSACESILADVHKDMYTALDIKEISNQEFREINDRIIGGYEERQT